MKIVNKYKLAECPAGTPFFVLNNKYWKSGGSKTYYSEGGIIDGSSMMIKTGGAFYSGIDNKPMFKGVTYIEPENYSRKGDYQEFAADTLPKKIELVTADVDSSDFDDNNRFLVLDSKDFRGVLDELEAYYLLLKENEKNR